MPKFVPEPEEPLRPRRTAQEASKEILPEDAHLSRLAQQSSYGRTSTERRVQRAQQKLTQRRNFVEQQFGEDSAVREAGLQFDLPADIDLDALVPATGEKYADWLDRRFSEVLKTAPGFGPRFALEVASADLSDEEVTGLSRALAQANDVFAKATEDKHEEAASALAVREVLSMDNIRQARAEALKVLQGTGRVLSSPDRLDSAAKSQGFQDFEDMVLQTAVRRINVDDVRAQARLESRFVDQVDTKENAEVARMLALRLTGGAETDEAAKRLGFQSFDALVAHQATRLAGSVAVAQEAPAGQSLRAGALSAAAFGFEPLEKVYRTIAQPIGFAGQYITEGLEAALAPVTHGLELLPGKQFSNAALTFDPPTPSEAWKRVTELGPGRALMIQSGAQPGSLEYQLGSATLDLMFRSVLDPGAVLGKAAKGVKAARTVVGADETLRGIARWTNQLLSTDDPRVLFSTGKGRKGVERLAQDIRRLTVDGKLNKNEIADKWRIHAGLLDGLERTQGNVDEVIEVLSESARGRASGQMIAGWRAEERALAEEIQALERATPEELAEAPALSGGIPKREGLLLLKKRRAELNNLIRAGRSTAVLREVPQNTVLSRVRQALKRPDLDTPGGRVVSFFTDPNWSRGDGVVRRHARGKIPTPVQNPFDRQAGRVYVQDTAKLLGLNRKDTDDFVNRYLGVTSHGELFQLFGDLAAKGRQRLPEGFGSELTRWADTPGAQGYWVGADSKTQIFDKWRYTDDVGRVWEQPILSTQRLRSLPAFDWQEIIRARTWTGKLVDRLKQAEGGVGKRKAALGLAKGIQATQKVAGVAVGMWAIGALLRVGWAIKINTEEMVRLFAVGVNPWEENFLHWFAKGQSGLTRDLRRYARFAPDADDFLPPPDEILANYGGALVERRAVPQGGIRKGQKGYYEGVQDSLAQLYAAPEVRHLARFGKERTVAWLLDPLGGKEILENQIDVIFKTRGDRLAHLSGDALTEAAAREWVDVLDEVVEATVGGSDSLRRVLKDGYLRVEGGRIGLDDALFPNELRAMPISELPEWGRPSGTSWQYGGSSALRNVAAKIMNAISATPSNRLNRIPAYRHFYDGELRRMRRLGVADDLAHQEARTYAARQVAEYLYDGAQRTATDEQVKNFIAFFPAYKEVATRWLGSIPAAQGIGVGHVVLARKVKILFDAMVNDKILVKNEEGEWVIKSEGLDGLLGYALGIVGIKGEFSPKSLGVVFGLPGLTPLGEGALAAIGKFVGSSKPYEEFVDFLTDGFGLSMDPTPPWMGRLMRYVGVKFGLSKFSTDYQDEQFANGVIDVLRTEMADELFALRDHCNVERAKGFTAETRQECEAEALDLWKRATQRAAGVLLRRSLLGVLSPWQPRLIWPGEEDAQAFREAAEAIPEGGDRSLLDRMIEASPKMELFLFAKTVRLRGAQAHEDARDAYWTELLDGTRQSLGPDWILFALGAADYSSIRRQQRAELAKLGDSASEWLRNGWKYREIQRTFSEKFEKLQLMHPKWWEVFSQKLEDGAIAEGRPLPDIEEQLVMEAANLHRILEFKFADPFNEHGPEIAKDIRAVAAQISDQYSLEKFYEKDRLVPGPERDLARYYSEVVGPYWNQVADIREKYIEGEKSKASQREGYRLLTELRNTYDSTLEGEAFPHPEEATYLMAHPNEKRRREMSWAMGRVEWLAPFQRRILDLEGDANLAAEYWGVIESWRSQMNDYLRSNGISRNSNRGEAIAEAVESRARALAQVNGLERDYALSQRPPFERAARLGLFTDNDGDTIPGAQRLLDGYRAAQAFLQQSEVGATSGVGREVVVRFGRWLGGLRAQYPVLSERLSEFFIAAPQNFRKSVDVNFVPFFFFGVTSPYGVE